MEKNPSTLHKITEEHLSFLITLCNKCILLEIKLKNVTWYFSYQFGKNTEEHLSFLIHFCNKCI